MSLRKGEMEYKLVIVIRDDLKMTGGKLAVQVAHAAVSCAVKAKSKKSDWFHRWFDEGQRKIVVRVKTLEEMLDLKDRASRAGLPNELIADAGLTELPPNTITCLGIGPGPDTQIDPITGALPLA
jgi:PTH2 family peptidyl-tRNA hydrolase